MRVVDGRHSGLMCEVVAVEAQEKGRSGGWAGQAAVCVGGWVGGRAGGWGALAD